MIDVDKVRELVELMVEHGLAEIKVREGETAISLRKTGPEVLVSPMQMAAHQMMAHPGAPAAPAAPIVNPDEGLVPIPSPMVGTFYAASDPDSPPYVKMGSEVGADSTVCIIEAMKVFNEIKAEVSGTVERVCVSNGQAVEFGQPLMLVRPR